METKSMIIDTEYLRSAATILDAVIERRNILPILGAVKLDGRTISGTDLDIDVSVNIYGASSPAIMVDFAPIQRLATAGLPTLRAALNEDGAGAKLTFDTGQIDFSTRHDPDEYKHIEFPSATHSISISGTDLLSALRSLAPAISTDPARYYANGVGVVLSGPKVSFVATDGHRLFEVSPKNVTSICDFDGIFIIPRKAVDVIIVALEAASPLVTIKIDFQEKTVRFRTIIGSASITGKLINAKYPNYHQVIPNNADKIMIFDRDAFLGALSGLKPRKKRKIFTRVKMTKVAIGISLSVQDDDGNTISAFLPASGDIPDVGFNYTYLCDMAASFEPGNITFAIENAGSPSLWTQEGNPAVGVLMPMEL